MWAIAGYDGHRNIENLIIWNLRTHNNKSIIYKDIAKC